MSGRKPNTPPKIRYFVDDNGGYASGSGPMADALLKIGWREVTKEEHDAAEFADPDRFDEDEEE